MLLRRSAFGRFSLAGLARMGCCNLREVSVSAAYDASACEYVLADASGGAFAIGLPSSPRLGAVVAVRKIDASSSVVDVGGLYELGAGGAIALRWQGASWEVVARETSASSAALQPSLYSPVAQWALDELTSTAVDRVNGYNLGAGTPTRGVCPDLIPGGMAQILGGRARLTGNAAFKIAGPLTLTCRVWLYQDVNEQILFQSGGTLNYWGVGLSAGSLRPYFGWNAAGGFEAYTLPVDLPLGEWLFLSFRRTAANVAVIGVNDTYYSGSPLNPCVTTEDPIVTVGCRNTLAAATEWEGAIADAGVWGADLSESQVEPLFYAAMGI